MLSLWLVGWFGWSISVMLVCKYKSDALSKRVTHVFPPVRTGSDQPRVAVPDIGTLVFLHRSVRESLVKSVRSATARCMQVTAAFFHDSVFQVRTKTAQHIRVWGIFLCDPRFCVRTVIIKQRVRGRTGAGRVDPAQVLGLLGVIVRALNEPPPPS